jgi:uncharacterized protein
MAVAEQTQPDYLRVKSRSELREIMSELRRGLEAIYGNRLQALYLYGSYVRGEARPGSDIDVLAILDEVESPSAEIERTSRLCAQISLEHCVTVSLLFRSLDRWQNADTPLVRNVRAEGRAA